LLARIALAAQNLNDSARGRRRLAWQ
jgi:hypothetical protein